MSTYKSIVVVSLVLLGACDTKKVEEALGQARNDNAFTNQTCKPRIPASSSIARVPNPEKPSACAAVVMMCNYCEYDTDGQLKASGSNVCGVCVGWELP